jgi:D-3-phosphoglycerate dehydrogenase
MAAAEPGHDRGREVVILTDGRADWYGDDYQLERGVWEPLGLRVRSGCGDSESSVIEQSRGADAIVSLGLRVPLTARVIDHLACCRLLVRAGTGAENIDLKAATMRGIVVSHVPDYCSVDVADHTVALILALARRVVMLDRYVEAGHWQDPIELTGPVHRLGVQTLGLIGFGRVGRLVATRMAPMVCRVVVHDPYAAVEHVVACGYSLMPLDAVLSEADILVLHVSLTAETRHMIGRTELARMKGGAILVNTSRGGVLDEAALIDALGQGHLAGAGLDVLEEEPPPADSPLFSLSNVIVTPHFAGYSEQAKVALRTGVAQTIADVMQGRWPTDVLNPGVKPGFALSEHGRVDGNHRDHD